MGPPLPWCAIARRGRAWAVAALRVGAAGLAIPAAAAAGSEAADCGEAWVRYDGRPIEVPGVARVEGVERAASGEPAWVRVAVEPWAIEALRASREVRDYQAAQRRSAPPEGYHDPDQIGDRLDALAQQTIRGGRFLAGRSVEGLGIEGLWLGQPPESGAPSVRLLGGHHGDERSSVEVALAVAEALADGDGDDPRITELLDRATVWLVPAVNPDGLWAGTRHNASGVDLNRNYDFGWSDRSVRPGPFPFSEPETRAVRALASFDRPLLSLTLHSGEANLGWPWNFRLDRPPDVEILASLAGDYADRCTAPGFWVTQGADWYVTFGDTNDWSYGRHGSLDLTLEVSDEKTPPAALVDEVIGWHLDAIVSFLATPPDLQGVVRDARTGLPVEARIALDGAERAVSSRPDTGSFALLAPPGSERLVVAAPGYEEAEVWLDEAGPLVEVALSPRSIAHSGRFSPSVIDGPTLVWLPAGAIGPLTLYGPDGSAIEAQPLAGSLLLGTERMAPGWWTVQAADGTTWPRALLVTEGATVGDRTLEGDTVRIALSPLGEGTRAWALWGPDRVPVPLDVVEQSDEDVVLDLAEVPRDRGSVDVLVFGGGAVAGIGDLLRPRLGARPGGLRSGACGCAGTSGPSGGPTGWAAIGGLIALLRRR